MKKRIKIFLIIFFAIILLVASFLIFQNQLFPKKVYAPSSSGSSGSSKPDPCSLIKDDYVKPDFNKMTELLKNEALVKDVPKNNVIQIMFYHFAEECRKWDAYYYLQDGQINQGRVSSDIDIWIGSNYADKFNGSNLCDVFKEANNKGEIAIETKISDSALMWKYKGMLKYKDCLGLTF